MKFIFPFLLIGTLSMFFAEIFSGASQMWFVNPFGLLLTFPLYLGHIVFFLWIGLKTKRISLMQLYLFGVLFGLYESWITKVLWSGYMTESGGEIVTFLGVGIAQFPILVFFWHPVMSFIMPILVYQILSGNILIEHESILKKTRLKSVLLYLCGVLFATFIATNGGFNLAVVDIAFLGTLFLIFVFYKFSKGADLFSLFVGKFGFRVWSSYLVLFYVLTFLFLLPERMPHQVLPYVTVIVFYILVIWLLQRTSEVSLNLKKLSMSSYQKRDLMIYFVFLFVLINIFCLVSAVSSFLMLFGYLIFIVVGVILFVRVVYGVFKKSL